ncbi:MAG: hypothetical protein HUU20_15355 [Pirellulales bacterium]|nr:hypothetical protein [Pirellulales bacterium]
MISTIANSPSQPTLVLPNGIGGGGFLSVPYPGSNGPGGGSYLVVRLRPALVYVVRALHKAYLADAGLPETMRGWRHPGVLATMIAMESGWQLNAQTVRAYMCKIERLMQAAVQDARKHSPTAALPSVLIERQKGFGARLAFMFGLRDLTDEADEE